MMYLMTEEQGIWKVPEKKPYTALFCKHRNVVHGKCCSKKGMLRISGVNHYAVCADCGTILNAEHIDYGG